MPNEPVEIEAKIHVANFEAIGPRLTKMGATLKAPRVYERNVRYEDSKKSLTPAHRVVRLRQDTRVRLTYKEPGSESLEGASARTELEVTVSDFGAMEAILGKLGYFPAWLYEKYRTTYEWHDVEIVLDEMPYGNFVEIEGPQKTIEDAVQALGLAELKRITASYSDLFFQLKARFGWPFNDLTFDNFRGLTLPDDSFDQAMLTAQNSSPVD